MTTSLFFYGTLCHRPLLARVLGRDIAHLGAIDAHIADHASYLVKDRDFPVLVAEQGATAQGLLVSDLTKADIARLDFYEGGFGYRLETRDVVAGDTTHPAQVYFADTEYDFDGRWDLSKWAKTWGDITVIAAAELMAHFGTTAPDDLRHLRPFFASRAWANILARDTAPQTLRNSATRDDIPLFKDTGGADGFFRLREFDIQFPRFEGGLSDVLKRSAFVAYDAALILPYDPKTDRVLLIEQLRYGPLARGDAAPWVLEPVAGLVDAGEDPADSALREALEETGLQIKSMETMPKAYASPGYSTEFFHCFLGLADLSQDDAAIGGLMSENENIRSHVVSFDQAMTLIDTGEINAVPLIMMLYWLDRERDRLRGLG